MTKQHRQLDIKNRVLAETSALGNSDRGLKEVVSDVLNSYGRGNLANVEKGTFLSRTTLDRLMTLEETEDGNPYRPQADTLERVLKYFGAELHFSQVVISPRWLPKPKV